MEIFHLRIGQLNQYFLRLSEQIASNDIQTKEKSGSQKPLETVGEEQQAGADDNKGPDQHDEGIGQNILEFHFKGCENRQGPERLEQVDPNAAEGIGVNDMGMLTPSSLAAGMM